MQLDIAHASFLEMIRTMVDNLGPAAAKGELVRMAMAIADNVKPIDYPSWDAYKQAIDDMTSPLAQLEGNSVIDDRGLATLEHCPFAPSIKTYVGLFGALPGAYAKIVEEFNRSGNERAITSKLRIGEGAGVSPFCAVHQALRTKVAEKITIAGKPLKVDMLACKSGSGKKGFADKWIATAEAEAGITHDQLDKALDTNMCSYFVRQSGK